MNDRETLVTDLNVFADFKPKLPEAYKSSPYVLLGNIHPNLQHHVASSKPPTPFGTAALKPGLCR